MSKLVYPKDSLYSYNKTTIDHIDECLERAVKKCNFDVPSEFKYANYLSGLSNTILGLKDKNNAIVDEIQFTDKYYSDLSNELTKRIKNVTIQKIIKRDRMII
ncbi:hypothetical protein IKF92_02095 [Candidatus Saccharibacteria bacterium]|nr:hypothetical protein [Candidatus Saccharibacteria bacterium]